MTVTSRVLKTVLKIHVTGKLGFVHEKEIKQDQHVRNALQVSLELTVTNLVPPAAKGAVVGTLVTVLDA